MALLLIFSVPSGIIIIASVPIYVLMLYSFFKFRKKSPFSSPFFVISFHLGIFDLLHLTNDWVFGMVNYIPGLYDIIVNHHTHFARAYYVGLWYTIVGQKMGVMWLAIDRVASMWFGHIFTKMQMKLIIGFCWIFPIVPAIPMFIFEFGYQTFNESRSVALYWVDVNAMFMWFTGCIFFCCGISVICAISYAMTFYKVYTHSKKSTAASAKKNRTEVKLAIAGFVLFIMTFSCGILCGLFVRLLSPTSVAYLVGSIQLLVDAYCCVNPYLILACSTAAWNHFRAAVLGKPPEFFDTKVSATGRSTTALGSKAVATAWAEEDRV